MVIVVVGQEKVAELAAAGALQGLRRDAAGVLPAVEAAAVRQGEVALGGEDDALALAHVQDLGVETAVGVAQGPQVHGVEKAGGGKSRREEPLPLSLLPGEPGDAEEQVEKPQPVFEVRIAEVEGVVGDLRQEPRHPEEVADQKPRQEGQDRPQGQPEEAQRHRQQPAAEDEPHAPETEEIADRRDEGQAVEIHSAEGRGKDHGPQGDGDAAAEESARRPQVPALAQPVAELGRHPEDAADGGKGELQADGGRGEGVRQQDEEQGREDGGETVPLPAEEGREEQEREHHAGPQHRGGRPGEQSVEKEKRQAQEGREPPPVAAQDQVEKFHEVGAVHPGDGEKMVKPHLGEVIPGLLGDAGAVPGQDCREEGGGILGEDGIDALRHGAGRPLGEPAKAPGAADLHGLLPSPVTEEEDAFGGEVPDVLIPDCPGAAEAHIAGDAVPRLQAQQGFAAVVDGLAGDEAFQPDGDLGTVLRGLRILAEGHGDGLPLRVRQQLRRGEDQLGVEGVVPKARRQGAAQQQRPPPGKIGPAQQEDRQGRQGKAKPRPRQPKRRRQQVLRQEDPQGESPAQESQSSHS